MFGIELMVEFRDIGGSRFSNFFPALSLEKGMLLDLVHPIDSQPDLRIIDKLADEVDCVERKVGILRDDESLPPVEYFLAGNVSLLGVERGIAHQHLVEDHPN
jgi:hypothetical protein